MTMVADVRAGTTFAERYQRNRLRSRALFDMLSDEAYYSRPIALRHPIVFYEGHLPAFTLDTLLKKALGQPGVDSDFEQLFARGIDPHEQTAWNAAAHTAESWPSRRRVQAFADEVDRRVLHVLRNEELNRPGHPLLDRAEAVFNVLEHEAMHQETLLYMWHRLAHGLKQTPADYRLPVDAAVPRQEWIGVPAGPATLGANREALEFGWDNECPALHVHVEDFEIDRHDVTNGAFLEFVEAGGYSEPQWWTPQNWIWVLRENVTHPLFWEQEGRTWQWRGMFDSFPLPKSWPVYVSLAEAAAFAKWRGARLPSEAEFQRAAYGDRTQPDAAGRQYPWGHEAPDERHGVFDFMSWDPHPAGSHPAGASAWGIEDLVGNGWEWTSTSFAPFPGFRAMASYPDYSADSFDGDHFVMKGASPATARDLLRPTFRNWFRPRYPYVYATFRCVRSGDR